MAQDMGLQLVREPNVIGLTAVMISTTTCPCTTNTALFPAPKSTLERSGQMRKRPSL